MGLPDRPDLPAQFQHAYESKRAAAELRLHEAMSHTGSFRREIAAFGTIAVTLDDTFNYCEEARNACRAGQLTVTQMRRDVERAKAPYKGSVETDPRWKQHLDEAALLAAGDASPKGETPTRPAKNGGRPKGTVVNGGKLRECRGEYSQLDFAGKLDVSLATYQRGESGGAWDERTFDKAADGIRKLTEKPFASQDLKYLRK